MNDMKTEWYLYMVILQKVETFRVWQYCGILLNCCGREVYLAHDFGFP